jgi:acyl carrier protein
MTTTAERVQAIIADALYLDASEVTPESTLMKDLGAESIDFLDIVFRLEKEFSIKLPKGDIERRARGSLSEDEFAIDGRLTPRALEQLQRVMPEVDPAALKAGFLLRDIPSLFTVKTFSRMVDEQRFGRLEDGEGALPGTGASATTRV